MGGGPGGVHHPVPAQLLRLRQVQGQAGVQLPGDEHGLTAQHPLGALPQRRHEIGHHAAENGPLKVRRLQPLLLQGAPDAPHVFRHAPAGGAVQPLREADGVAALREPLHPAEADGGVSDVDGQDHRFSLSFLGFPRPGNGRRSADYTRSPSETQALFPSILCHPDVPFRFLEAYLTVSCSASYSFRKPASPRRKFPVAIGGKLCYTSLTLGAGPRHLIVTEQDGNCHGKSLRKVCAAGHHRRHRRL